PDGFLDCRGNTFRCAQNKRVARIDVTHQNCVVWDGTPSKFHVELPIHFENARSCFAHVRNDGCRIPADVNGERNAKLLHVLHQTSFRLQSKFSIEYRRDKGWTGEGISDGGRVRTGYFLSFGESRASLAAIVNQRMDRGGIFFG